MLVITGTVVVLSIGVEYWYTVLVLNAGVTVLVFSTGTMSVLTTCTVLVCQVLVLYWYAKCQIQQVPSLLCDLSD